MIKLSMEHANNIIGGADENCRTSVTKIQGLSGSVKCIAVTTCGDKFGAGGSSTTVDTTCPAGV